MMYPECGSRSITKYNTLAGYVFYLLQRAVVKLKVLEVKPMDKDKRERNYIALVYLCYATPGWIPTAIVYVHVYMDI